jgi:hypothetical protein
MNRTQINLIFERTIDTMKKRKLLFFSLILATLAIGVVIGTVVNHSVNADKAIFGPAATALAIPSPSSPFSQILD